MRAAATGELAHHWPEAQGLLPPEFGREVDRYCVLELERDLEPGAEPPDAPAELADAVSAIRLATAAPVAAGPVLFERLDWRPFGIRPCCRSRRRSRRVRPRASTPSVPRSRARCCHALLADGDAPLAEALDRRGELSLFQNEPFRSEQLRGALAGCSATRGSSAPPSCSAMPARSAVRFMPRCGRRPGEQASPRAEEAVRRSLVETLRHGDRPALVRSLDDVLLGLRSAPRLAHAG